MIRRFWMLAIATLPACATVPSGPAVTAPAGALFTYAVPSPATLNYAFADSSGFNVQGGAIGDVRVSIATSGTAAVTYMQKGSELEATIRIADLAGSVMNSAMGSTVTATEADVQGNAVVTVTARGVTTVAAVPRLNAAAQQLGLGGSFFRRFFARLPAGRVLPGSTWIDTLTVTEDVAGTKVDATDVVTSTFARDTVINGRTLALITTDTQRRVDASGTSQGVEVVQHLTGTATGKTLWDPERNLAVERTESSQLSGTFNLPQMGVTGLPVTASGSSRIVLQ